MGEEIRITAADGGTFAALSGVAGTDAGARPDRVAGDVQQQPAHPLGRRRLRGGRVRGPRARRLWRQEAGSYLPYTDEGRAKAQALRARLDTDQFDARPRRRHRRAAGAPGLHRQGRRDGVLPGRPARLPGQHAAADRRRGQLLRRADRPASRRGRPPQVPAPHALRRERSACAGGDRGGDPGAPRRTEQRRASMSIQAPSTASIARDTRRTTRRPRRRRGSARSRISAVSCRRVASTDTFSQGARRERTCCPDRCAGAEGRSCTTAARSRCSMRARSCRSAGAIC